MANKNLKIHPTSLDFGKPQIKTTMSYHYTFIRMTKIEKIEQTEC